MSMQFIHACDFIMEGTQIRIQARISFSSCATGRFFPTHNVRTRNFIGLNYSLVTEGFSNKTPSAACTLAC